MKPQPSVKIKDCCFENAHQQSFQQKKSQNKSALPNPNPYLKVNILDIKYGAGADVADAE